MHRDLKPANIMLKDHSDLSSLKIVDFGLSMKYQTGDVSRHCGTRVYMAPEVLLTKHEYTKSVDVWAVGIILYEVLTGGQHPIFKPNDTKDTYEDKVRKL
jgi:calcium/calmodulin-dependent protein kinase I